MRGYAILSKTIVHLVLSEIRGKHTCDLSGTFLLYDIEGKCGLTVLSKSMKINGGWRLDYGENTIDFAV